MFYFRVLSALLVLIVWGSSGTSQTSQPQHTETRSSPDLAQSSSPEQPSPPPAQPEIDPYEGWENWCEPFDYERSCKTADDCGDIQHPARRALRCVHPWYAKENPDYRVCAPGYAGKKERLWRFNRLREIVRQQYFQETQHCKLDSRPLHKEHWRCQKATLKGDKLTQFLWIGYKRETTGRPWKRHRLDSDVKAAKTMWYRQAETYGWSIELSNGEVVRMKPTTKDANPYYAQRHRWHYGLGPIGQNAPLWSSQWDPLAPPEVLCRAVPAFEAYLRKAREVLHTLRVGIRCDGQRYRERKPTWATVHRAVNLGSICPPTTQRHYDGLQRFYDAANAQGLDPHEVVDLGILGTPVPVEGQNDWALEIENAVERAWPTMEEDMRQTA